MGISTGPWLQVNLAPLLPKDVSTAMRKANVTAEFHITPPAWPYPPTEAKFRPFAVPLVEVRRRLAAIPSCELPDSARVKSACNFFLKYRWVRGGVVEPKVLEYRLRGGVVVKGDAVLGAPLPEWRATLHRFRTFSLTSSPCRH